MSYQNLNPPPQEGLSQSGYSNPADMPMQNPKDQIAMWQRASYMPDSGIQSANPSQAPSLSGKEEQMETVNDWVEGQTAYGGGFGRNSESGYTSEQIEDIGQHLSRNAKLNERMETPVTPFDSPMPNSNMSDPCQMINMTYQDGDQAEAAIAELIDMLNDKDQEVVSKAAWMILKLTKGEAYRNAIVHSNLVANLVKTLTTSTNLETARVAVEALHNLSNDKDGRFAIFKSGGIKILVQLLSSPKERILNCAITTLHNLLLHQEGSKASVRLAGGLQEMVALLKRNNEKFLAIVTDCLVILAVKNQESKHTILASNGPQELVRILRTFSYEKLLWTTTRALKVLSVCSSNKPAIIAAGGMQALATHLSCSPSRRVLMNCLWTLRNLSDAATKLENLDDLLRCLVVWLSYNDPSVVTCCAGILFNLTCNNQRNKKIVCQSGGIDRLLDIIHNAGSKEEITEHAVCALRHLTARHPDALLAQGIVGEKGGITIILNLLHQAPKWPLVRAVVGLVKNLAMCPANQLLIRESIAIHKLTDLLLKTSKESSMMVDGVRMEDIVEGILTALNLLTKDPPNRSLMRHLNLKAICAQLQNSIAVSVKREANEILNKLSMEEIVMKKEEPNPMSPLNDVMQQGNLASYEGTMLLQIAKEKTEERPEAMPPNIKMFRDDAPMWPPMAMSQMPPDFQDLINCPEGYDPMYGPPSVQNPPNYLAGFDHVPMDPMPDLEIGPQHGPCAATNYGPMDHMDLPPVHPPNLDYDHQVPPPPRKETNQWHKCSYCLLVYPSVMEANACQAKHLQ